MKRGPRPTTPSTKLARGTYKKYRDAGRVEFDPPAPGSVPIMPDWLTEGGKQVWLENIERPCPPLTESDSVGYGLWCNLVASIGQAYNAGDIPPIAALSECRRLCELLGMMGAQSRVGDKAALRNGPNPFARFVKGVAPIQAAKPARQF